MNWKHIFHIVRKDCRAQRFHLILWGVLLALYAAILSQSELGQPAGASAMTILAHLLPIVVIVHGLAVVVTLIQSDPVAGTSAFWLTRPVRGASLLAAKTIEVAAMAALWFVAEFLILVANGVADQAGYLAFGLVTGLLPVLLVAAAIAALVPSMPRFLLILALVVVGYGVLASAMHMVTGWFFVPEATSNVQRSLGVRLSGQLVGASIVALGAIAILGWQFFTRRTGISIITALIAGTGAALAFSTWSHDFIGQRVSRVGASEKFDAVRLEIDSSNLRPGDMTYTIDGADPVKYRTVSAMISAHGLPDGVFADFGTTRIRAITPDGREFLQHPYNETSYQRLGGISSVLGGVTIGGDKGGKWWSALIRTGEDEFEQFAHQPCTLESEIQLDLFRYELLGELPLERGAQGRFDGLQIRITDVDARPDNHTITAVDDTNPETKPSPYQCEVHFSEKYPNSKLKEVREGPGGDRHLYSDLTYVLINRQKNEALLSNGGGFGSFGGLRMMFHFNERKQKFHPANGTQRSARFDREWFAGASLAILKLNSLGQITRSATIKDIVFDP